MHQRIISLREAYNSNLNSNLSETIRTLTVIATIILPLTLITGIYGMNFAVYARIKITLWIFLCIRSTRCSRRRNVYVFQEKRMGIESFGQ